MLKNVSVPAVLVGPLGVFFFFQLSLFQYLTFVTDNGGTLMHLFVVWLKTCAVLQYRIQMRENYSVMNIKCRHAKL